MSAYDFFTKVEFDLVLKNVSPFFFTLIPVLKYSRNFSKISFFSANFFSNFIFLVVEHACSVPSLIQGETLQGVSQDMDIKSYREPLGVCSGVAPFNFPAMIPLWMFPLALMCGNTFVMKPSEPELQN